MCMATSPSDSKPRVLVVATSLNPGSRSFLLAREAYALLQQREVDSELVDLRELDLPFADGVSDFGSRPGVARIKAAFKQASHIILAVPIYNGDVNAATRNLPNLGCDFAGRTVGFLCAAGGARSYMAIYSLANSLMFEYLAWIVPRHVYATKADFSAGRIASAEVLERIGRLLDSLLHGPGSRDLS